MCNCIYTVDRVAHTHNDQQQKKKKKKKKNVFILFELNVFFSGVVRFDFEYIKTYADHTISKLSYG